MLAVFRLSALSKRNLKDNKCLYIVEMDGWRSHALEVSISSMCVKEKARIKRRDGDFHNYFSRVFYLFICMSYRHNS